MSRATSSRRVRRAPVRSPLRPYWHAGSRGVWKERRLGVVALRNL
ncbi:hypothetical protein [Deinococcus sp.]|nr:hypothetical protein [Deinococcus sp.]